MKLEDIPKKQTFQVPEGYFEKLPSIIQARITQPTSVSNPWFAFRYGLRFALPSVVILIAAIAWFTRTDKDLSAEAMLSAIQTPELVAYLNDGDLTTEELLENVQLDEDDVTQIEEAVFDFELSDETFEDIVNDTD